MSLSQEAFKSCERQFVKVLDHNEGYKKKVGGAALAEKFMRQKFEHDLIVDLPKQIEKFFELQHFDIEDEDLDNVEKPP